MIPCGASSIAIASQSARTPCFVAPYTAIVANGIWTWTDDVKTIRPGRPERTIAFAAAWPTLKAPVRLTRDDPVERLRR